MTGRVTRIVDSPVGPLSIHAADGHIVSLDFGVRRGVEDPSSPILNAAAAFLAAYFDGDRGFCTLPLRPAGSAFHQQVWGRMLEIPFGDTDTYGSIAKRLGNTARAVGQACGANPIPVLIPCHRVVGADGRLGGFSGKDGLPTKINLLRHEGVLL